jgi:hypothetical protein
MLTAYFFTVRGQFYIEDNFNSCQNMMKNFDYSTNIPPRQALFIHNRLLFYLVRGAPDVRTRTTANQPKCQR